MRAVVSALLLAAAFVSAQVSAEPLRSSEDIVKFFAEEVELGATRGICVGTEEECRDKAEAPARAGLDMLINFDLNSADLTPEARAKLDEFAKALRDNRLRSHNFLIEGHTDARGSAEYNLGLSQQRAKAVAGFLLSNGIEVARITATGMGKNRPRAPDPYDPVNRRVEMRINLQ